MCFLNNYRKIMKKLQSICEDQNLLYNLVLLYKNQNWYWVFFFKTSWTVLLKTTELSHLVKNLNMQIFLSKMQVKSLQNKPLF